jgi:hypothetical protein
VAAQALGREHEGAAPLHHGIAPMAAESIAGWGGIVLGILALLNLAPSVLLPVAVIVLGGGLLLGMGLASRPARAILGLAAIALGILALLRIDARTLTLVGLIATGSALLLTGPVVAMRMHDGARHPAA